MVRRADLLYESGREWDGCKGESGGAGDISGGHPGRSVIWDQTNLKKGQLGI